MAILDSVNELAKRFGVETEEQTISEQIDAINQKLDESYTGSRDIEESVSQFAKNDGPDARLGTKTITENDTYIALDDELDGYSSVTVNVAAPTPETFEVEITFDENLTPTVNKTYNEMKAAIDAGKTIVGVMTSESFPNGSVQLSGGYYTPNFTIHPAQESQDIGEGIILISNPFVFTAYQQTCVINVAILKDVSETPLAIAYAWG